MKAGNEREAQRRAMELLTKVVLEQRDYALWDGSALTAMTDMVWYPPYMRDISHCHNCMEIGLCMEGTGKIGVGGVEEGRPFCAGTVVIVPSGVYHSQQNEGESRTRWRYIIVDERRLLRELPSALRRVIERFLNTTGRGGVYLHECELAARVGAIMDAMFECKKRLGEDAAPELEAQLLRLLATVAREPISSELKMVENPLRVQPVEPALLFVSENYGMELRVGQMARCCAMSESHFRKTFLRIMGVSPLEYLNRFRIHRAMHMLREGKQSIQNIASECGFVSVATFNRNFARYVGQSPSTWRQMHG